MTTREKREAALHRDILNFYFVITYLIVSLILASLQFSLHSSTNYMLETILSNIHRNIARHSYELKTDHYEICNVMHT